MTTSERLEQALIDAECAVEEAHCSEEEREEALECLRDCLPLTLQLIAETHDRD
jgi:hypothetical protein